MIGTNKRERERVRQKSCRNVTWKIDWSNHLNEDVLIMKLWRHLKALSQWLQEDFMGDPCIQAMLNLNLGLTQITRQLRSSFSREVVCQFQKKAPYSARICGSRYLSHHLHLWVHSWGVWAKVVGGVGAHQHLFLGFVPCQCLEIRRGRLYVVFNFCSYSLHHESW